jgi:hypothetical protein
MPYPGDAHALRLNVDPFKHVTGFTELMNPAPSS